MRISRTEIMRFSKLMKSLNGSGASATSLIGALSAQYVHPVTDLFQIEDTRSAGRDKGEWA